MAKGGKHLGTGEARPASGGESKRKSGAHEAPRKTPAVNKVKRHRSMSIGKALLTAVVLLLFCIVMVSPLKGCILTDDGYIGVTAAQKVAIGDSGILTDKAKNVNTAMIKLDGQMCYKVEFTGSVTDYRYIIDAKTGDILYQAFYRLDGN